MDNEKIISGLKKIYGFKNNGDNKHLNQPVTVQALIDILSDNLHKPEEKSAAASTGGAAWGK